MTTPKETEKLGIIPIWREVCAQQKTLMVMLIVATALAAVLLVFALFALRPQSTTVFVGYRDVYGEIAGVSAGYRSDSWLFMLAFPILALLYGTLHSILALRVYQKHGRDAAIAIVVMTILIILATFMTIIRLMGEW